MIQKPHNPAWRRQPRKFQETFSTRNPNTRTSAAVEQLELDDLTGRAHELGELEGRISDVVVPITSHHSHPMPTR
jgi:hypothetical protein